MRRLPYLPPAILKEKEEGEEDETENWRRMRGMMRSIATHTFKCTYVRADLDAVISDGS